MKNKYYAIFQGATLMAYGKANRYQVRDWEKAAFTVLRAI